jgi:predicted hydrocarbon binding protein
MAEIKGILLNAWVKFLNDRYGEQAVTNALVALSPEDRQLVPAKFLDASWYPFDALHALGKLTRPLLMRADRGVTTEIGRYMAQHAFTGVYRPLLAHDPIKQVEKFTSIGEFFFREARKLETEITGPASCLVRYRYEPGARPSRSICGSLSGFWSRSIELAGASNVKVSHPKCVATGADCCEFVFDWKPADTGSLSS